MIKYTVFDRVSGEFLRTGSAPEHQVLDQARQGEVLFFEEYDPHIHWFDPDLEKVVARKEPLSVQPPLNYQELRRIEYPQIADQLDAMWKGGKEAEAMRREIMAIKSKYPKE